MSEPLNEEEATNAANASVRTGKLCGLINHGTNDNLNVVLQVLYNVREFRIALYQSFSYDTVPLIKCLVNIFARMHLSQESNPKPPSAIETFDVLSEYVNVEVIREFSS
jgi:uncharacterized UBP type Zn finger protein